MYPSLHDSGSHLLTLSLHLLNRYARLARAHFVNGDKSLAMDALAKALRRPELENEIGLVGMLIEFQTEGKGLPEDMEQFKAVAKRLIKGDEESAKRMKDVKGLWYRLVVERYNATP